MFNKKILALAAAAVMIAGEASAGTTKADAARKIGEALKNEFSPDSVSVTVSNDGKRAWAECAGAVISGIKIKEAYTYGLTCCLITTTNDIYFVSEIIETIARKAPSLPESVR